VMGLGTAKYLACYELDHGVDISDTFQAFSGTSIGSVNASFLAMGNTAIELEAILSKNLKSFFSDKTMKFRFGFCPKYKDTNILKALDYYFGDRTFGMLRKQLYITAWDARKKDLKVWSNEDCTMKIKEAIRASISAPTYFSPVQGRYVDGGLCANNPTLIGLAHLLKNKIVTNEIKVVDMVTSGYNKERTKLKSSESLLSCLKGIVIPAVTSGNSSDTEYLTTAWLQSLGMLNSYFRVSPFCDDWEMDDYTKLDAIANVWERQYHRHAIDFRKFLNN